LVNCTPIAIAFMFVFEVTEWKDALKAWSKAIKGH
jgi:hypothetical protein